MIRFAVALTIAVSIAMSVLLTTVLPAPPPAVAPAPQASQPTQVVVTVRDDVGHYIYNLKADDFVLEENGKRQEVTKFSANSEVPVSLGILIDKSASMRLPLAVQGKDGKDKVSAALLAADGAARVLVKLMKPQDEFMVMVFDDSMKVKQSFSSDQKKVTEVLNKNNQVGGSTHLYKAVTEALKETKKGKYRKRALVVITDVHDTSGDKLDQLKASLHDEEVPVYTFGMKWDAWGLPGDNQPAKPTFEVEILRELAADSGGRSMIVDIPDLTNNFTVTQMIGFVGDIASELRGQYTLTYNSNNPGPDAEKAIRIRAVSPDFNVRYQRDNSVLKPDPKVEKAAEKAKEDKAKEDKKEDAKKK